MKQLLTILLICLFSGSLLAHPHCGPKWPRKPCPPKPKPKEELSSSKKDYYPVWSGAASTIAYGACRDRKLPKLQCYLLAVGSSLLIIKGMEGGDLQEDAVKAAAPGALLGPLLFFEF